MCPNNKIFFEGYGWPCFINIQFCIDIRYCIYTYVPPVFSYSDMYFYVKENYISEYISANYI